MSEEMDYEKIGLKCGIEIHQQLETRKLFCTCRSSMSGTVSGEISRRLRAVAGELGQVDAAAMHEFLKNREFLYKLYSEESCLVEADEEPPHPMNREALDIGLSVALLMKCFVPDEIHVMRKQVIDGSNTSGFQRTALIGLDGILETKSGRVGITNVSVEEDACQILERKGNKTVYGLNRLGIPLVEIGTTPDIKSPRHAHEVAAMIGMILRSTGRVKRGLGTIRQDINISIKGGARIEIKGAQELRLIPAYVEHEVMRQKALIEIKNELKSKGFAKIKPDIKEVTSVFRDSKSPVVKGKPVFAVKLKGLSGFLKRKLTPTRTLGKELANYVNVKSGARGFIHTDEDLKKYGLEKEFKKFSKEMKSSKKDCIAIVSGEKSMCIKALESLVERVNMLAERVPEETRRALDNGDSEYMRPLPGAARLYPETDIPPITVSRKKIQDMEKNLPELLDKKAERFMKEYGLNKELSIQVVNSGYWNVFEEAVRTGLKPAFVASFLTNTLKQLKRKEGVEVEKVNSEMILDILKHVKNGKATREQAAEAVKILASGKKKSAADAIKSLGSALCEKDIRKIIKIVINKNMDALEKPRAEKILMGEVMKELRGKAPGNVVMRILADEIKRAKKK